MAASATDRCSPSCETRRGSGTRQMGLRAPPLPAPPGVAVRCRVVGFVVLPRLSRTRGDSSLTTNGAKTQSEVDKFINDNNEDDEDDDNINN